MVHKSAFIAIVGRPNVGKSTLVNSLVGSKVAITSRHPNTTRTAIRGIITRKDLQLVLVDTPGVHKPKTALGQRLNDVAQESMESVDIVALCIPANEEIRSGDQFIAQEIARHRNAKKFLLLTKIDAVDKNSVLTKLSLVNDLAVSAGFSWDEIVPLAAKKGEQIPTLLELFAKYAPESPAFFPDDMASDQSTEMLLSEYIREAAIADVFHEVPHSIAVVIDELSEREKRKPTDRPFFDIHATIHVERDSQKAIIIGEKGERLKKVGMAARAEIEKLMQGKVFLGLHIRVTPDWQRDPKALRRFGLITE